MGTPEDRNLISVRYASTICLFLEGTRNKREMGASQARNPIGVISRKKASTSKVSKFESNTSIESFSVLNKAQALLLFAVAHGVGKGSPPMAFLHPPTTVEIPNIGAEETPEAVKLMHDRAVNLLEREQKRALHRLEKIHEAKIQEIEQGAAAEAELVELEANRRIEAERKRLENDKYMKLQAADQKERGDLQKLKQWEQQQLVKWNFHQRKERVEGKIDPIKQQLLIEDQTRTSFEEAEMAARMLSKKA